MSIKKGVIGIFILLIFIISFYFLFKSIQSNQSKKEVYQTIPSFELYDINNNKVTDSSLKINTPILFMFFDPACGSCRSEFVQIQQNKRDFENIQLVFFSTLPADTITHFLHEIDFIPTSNMFFLVDGDADLMYSMEIKGPPSSLIYNRERRLIKRFDGIVKVETLIKYLSK